MESLLLRLPKRPQPFLVRFAATTAIVAVCIAAQWGLARLSGLPGLFILLVGVVASSTLFDRVCGIYATLIGAISSYLLIRELFPQVPGFAPLVILSCVGIAIAVFSEALRLTMERAVAAEREKDILFGELSHRMHNNLTIAVSLLEMQGRAHENPEVRTALSNAADRVSILAEGQQNLQLKGAGLVGVQCYLGRICAHLSRSIGGVRAIEIEQALARTKVSAEKAMVLGLIANELITNAIKYAFPGERQGRIAVGLAPDEATGELVLTVADNGVGYAADAAEGFGTRLIQGLTMQHGGRSRRVDAAPGCRVEVRIPVTTLAA